MKAATNIEGFQVTDHRHMGTVVNAGRELQVFPFNPDPRRVVPDQA